MSDIFRQFYQISKIDQEKQIVYGIASTPAVDSQGEVVPPNVMEAAMPAYMLRGNLREMHANIAAGKVLDWRMNDKGETEIAAKVVDPTSWLKVKEGVLTGFSIAGNGTTKTLYKDNRALKVYEKIDLTEISLVDSPANPEANITLWKASRPSKRGNVNEMEQKEIQEQLESAGAGLLKLAKASSTAKKAKPAVKVAAKAKAAAKAKTRKADDSSDAGATDETADAPDLTPEQIMQGMLALHNAMVMAGNMDGAAGITDSIACFQASLNDQSADDAGDADMDGDTDLELDDDSGLAMADGDSDTTDNNDDITGDQEDDANSGPDFSTKADEGAPSDDDRQDVDSPPDNSDETDKAKKSKTLKTSKALTFRGAGSYRGLLSKVNAYDPQREMAVTKAMTANFTKVAQVLEGFSARLDNLEAQPRQGGPAVRAVEKSLVSGGANGNGGQMDEVQALQKALDTTSDPFLKTRLREEIAVAETRTMYRFTTS